MSPNGHEHLRASIAELAERPGELPLLLLDRAVAPLLEQDPDAPTVARACAVARWFDPETIGVLRGAPRPDRDQALHDVLREFELVEIRRDGKLAFRTTLAEAVLPQVHAEVLHARLIRHHLGRLDTARALRDDLSLVAEVMRAANPARLARLVGAIEHAVIDPLFEVQYHSTCRSDEDGLQFFRETANRLLDEGASDLCGWFIRAQAEELRRRDGNATARWNGWVALWDLRLRLINEGPAELVDPLRALAASPSARADLELRVTTLSQLHVVLLEQGRLAESEAVCEEASELACDEAVPRWHRARVLVDLGNLRASRRTPAAARTAYEQAISVADEAGAVGLAVQAQLGLSQIEMLDGAGEEAFDRAIDALDLARSGVPLQDASFQRAVGLALLELFGRYEPGLVRTLEREIRELTPESSDPSFEVVLACRYSIALRSAHRLSAAHAVVDNARSRREREPTRQGAVALAYEIGHVAAEMGRDDEARQAYDLLSDRMLGSDWDRAAGLNNRGFLELQHDPAAAETMLRNAREAWSGFGHQVYARVAASGLATALALQGKHDEAAAELRSAEPLLRDAPRDARATFLEATGDVARQRGDYAAARTALAAAAAEYRALRMLRQYARITAQHGEVAARTTDWHGAVSLSSDTNEAWRLIADADAADLHPVQEQADEENALGMRALCRGRKHPADNLQEARLRFEAAQALWPDNRWYSLNLAYVCAALGDDDAAGDAARHVADRRASWGADLLEQRRAASSDLDDAGTLRTVVDAVRSVVRSVTSGS